MGKRVSRKDTKIKELANALVNNGKAIQEGGKRKNWTHHDLRSVKPLTDNQAGMFEDWFNGFNICAYGSAGTGKSFLAFYLAFTSMIERQEQDRIIVVRSVVPTRDVGFLPGTLEEKVALYELPYHDICYELMGRHSTYEDMKNAGRIEFITTSFIRGLTWDNAVIIIDEAQNMTLHELDSVMTRIGNNTRIIVTGDVRQTDLEVTKKAAAPSGLKQFIEITKNMNEFAQVEFTAHDIVRSALVKSWIIASERFK